jgi:hypothetical protein
MNFETGAPAPSRILSFRRFAASIRSFALRHHWHGLNLAIPGFMLAYTVVAAALCAWFGRAVDFRLTLYFPPFYSSYLLGLSILAVVVAVRHAFGRSHQRFLFFPRVWRPQDFLHSLIAAAPFLVAWPLFMAGFTAVKTLLNDIVPFTWDFTFMTIGRELHFGKHPWQWLGIENPAVTHFLESAYAFWGVLLVAVPLAVTLRRPNCAARARFLISMILVFILLGNLVAGAFMSAGPFWFELSGAEHNDYAGLFAYLMQADPNGDFSAISFQRYLWHAYTAGATQVGTGISAFPSVHVAVATLYALYAWPLGRLPRVAAVLYLLAVTVGAVHLGWHYSLDCYAGFLGAVVIYGAVGGIQRLHARVSMVESGMQSAPP